MPPAALLKMILLVAAQAFLIYCLSRILFVWVLQSVAMRSHGGGWFVKLLRLPGNLVHELSHALGYLLSGFRVKRLLPCVLDPDGRGLCQPGERWHELATMWLATGLAAIMPLLVGPVFLRGAAVLLSFPLAHMAAGGPQGVGALVCDVLRQTFFSLNGHDWRTYVFLYLGFSVGAEMAPSDIDFRRSLLPLAVTAVLMGGASAWLGYLHPESQAWAWYSTHLFSALNWLFSLLAFAILATALVAAITLLPALLWRGFRKLVFKR
jgi:hypothetical protein